MDNINEEATESTISQFAWSIHYKMSTYYPLLSARHIIIASALDPRIKKSIVGTEVSLEELVYHLKTEWEIVYADLHEELLQINRVPSGDEVGDMRLLALLNASAEQAETGGDSITEVIDCWFRQPCIPILTPGSSVLLYMKLNQDVFPCIAIMARDYLAMTTTSVPSEEAFSRAGCIVNDFRSRLTDDSISTLCEMQSFLDYTALLPASAALAHVINAHTSLRHTT
jgi:hAT family C-terminal dimerisation region